MERFVPLLQNIRTIPACLAVELSCRRHVALQWEYARARHAEYNDVLAGCRVQLLPDLSDEACGVVRSSIYRSRCRSGCERCYIGNGIGRTRYRRRNDVVSMPPLAHAEVRRRTGKFSTQTGDIAICGAQIATTVVVAPLGIVAIAANSFAIIAESLCYMPGYGISEAATTLVGQSLGANRIRLLRRFANITVWSGMLIMGVMGALIYVAAPQIIGVMTPVEEIRTLGIEILRIEAFAEPMFAASIVAYGVFVGVGNTFVPSLMNFGSIWGVRLTLAAWLAPTMGLRGVWLAMCIELCFRGVIFLARLWGSNWIYKLRINR